MPSTDLPPRPSARLFAGALLAATALQLVELLLPRIPLLPWLRPGFSWIVLLPFLLDFGVVATLGLFLARNVLSMAFGGQPASTFLISTCSGAAAILLAGTLLRSLVHWRLLGRAGASVALAATFNGLQLLTVAGVLVGSGGYLSQIGPLVLWSVASGLVVAWLSLPLGEGRGWRSLEILAPPPSPMDLAKGSLPASLSAGAMMFLSLAASDLRLAGASVLLALAWGRGLAARAILATWPFLPYLAWFHLLGTPGDLLAGSNSITRQGLEQFASHALRLWAFTAWGRILTSHLPWSRLLAGRGTWSRGVAMAIPAMSRLFPAAIAGARRWWREGRQGGLEGFLARFSEGLRPVD